MAGLFTIRTLRNNRDDGLPFNRAWLDSNNAHANHGTTPVDDFAHEVRRPIIMLRTPSTQRPLRLLKISVYDWFEERGLQVPPPGDQMRGTERMQLEAA